MPAFEVVFVRVDFFAFDCLPHFVHVFYFSPDFYLPLFFNLGHGVPPTGWYFPELNCFEVYLDSAPSAGSDDHTFMLDIHRFGELDVIEGFEHI